MEQNYFPPTYFYELLCQETFRTTKLVRLLLESLNAFAESPETLRTRQKLLRNSKILKDITKNRSVMVKGEKVSISLRQNKMI